MVANPARRAAVAEAALALLGADGARALTHRAVDRQARLPPGTCANYFPTRSALLAGMAAQVFESLQPSADRLAVLERVPAGQAGPEYVAYVVERLLAQPDLARALIELRLEGGRSPEIGEPLRAFLRDGLARDLAFHEKRGLPGGREVLLDLHHVVNGIVFDAVTLPIEPGDEPVERARRLAERALAGASSP